MYPYAVSFVSWQKGNGTSGMLPARGWEILGKREAIWERVWDATWRQESRSEGTRRLDPCPWGNMKLTEQLSRAMRLRKIFIYLKGRATKLKTKGDLQSAGSLSKYSQMGARSWKLCPGNSHVLVTPVPEPASANSQVAHEQEVGSEVQVGLHPRHSDMGCRMIILSSHAPVPCFSCLAAKQWFSKLIPQAVASHPLTTQIQIFRPCPRFIAWESWLGPSTCYLTGSIGKLNVGSIAGPQITASQSCGASSCPCLQESPPHAECPCIQSPHQTSQSSPRAPCFCTVFVLKMPFPDQLSSKLID